MLVTTAHSPEGTHCSSKKNPNTQVSRGHPLVAAAALLLAWCFVTQLAPSYALQNGSHSQDLIFMLSQNALIFGAVLALAMLPGMFSIRWAQCYYKLITCIALLAVAVLAWDTLSPATQLYTFVNSLLDERFGPGQDTMQSLRPMLTNHCIAAV